MENKGARHEPTARALYPPQSGKPKYSAEYRPQDWALGKNPHGNQAHWGMDSTQQRNLTLTGQFILVWSQSGSHSSVCPDEQRTTEVAGRMFDFRTE